MNSLSSLNNLQIVYVGISLILVYLYLSAIGSIVQEWIAQLLHLRASTLKSGIGTLLNDPEFKGLAHGLFQHGLVKGISPGPYGPSYLPSRTFASVLTDLLAPRDSSGKSKTFDEVRHDISSLKSDGPLGPLKTALLVLADQANGDLPQFRAGLEHWFDSAMDRVGGVYKRYTQIILFVIGLVLAIILNADTFAISHTVASPDVIAAAAKVVGSPPTPSAGTNSSPVARPAASIIDTLRPVLALGWCANSGSGVRSCQMPTDFYSWLAKIIGFLITALMVSLGAPFWFDLLDNIMNIRSSGAPPPSRSDEVPSVSK